MAMVTYNFRCLGPVFPIDSMSVRWDGMSGRTARTLFAVKEISPTVGERGIQGLARLLLLPLFKARLPVV